MIYVIFDSPFRVSIQGHYYKVKKSKELHYQEHLISDYELNLHTNHHGDQTCQGRGLDQIDFNSIDLMDGGTWSKLYLSCHRVNLTILVCIVKYEFGRVGKLCMSLSRIQVQLNIIIL